MRRILFGAVSMPPYHYGGILAENPPDPGEFDAISTNIARLIRLHTLHISCAPNVTYDIWSKYQALMIKTQIVDLSSGYTHIWKNSYDNKQRNCIRYARKAGIHAYQENSDAAFDLYHSLYFKSCERWNQTRPDPKNLLHILLKEQNTPVKLWIAMYGNNAIASAVIASNERDTIYYLYGVSDEEFWKFHPNNLLIDEIIQTACKDEFQQFDMLPSGRLSGVEKFKASFGAEDVHTPEYWLPGFLPMLKRKLFA
jgi:hypothetical protein